MSGFWLVKVDYVVLILMLMLCCYADREGRRETRGMVPFSRVGCSDFLDRGVEFRGSLQPSCMKKLCICVHICTYIYIYMCIYICILRICRAWFSVTSHDYSLFVDAVNT